jgi:2-dehydro-3-deoxygluconokinase
VIASEDEIELAVPAGTADPVGALLEAGVEEVVLTAGARGASRHAADGVEHVAAVPVPTVDPVGAGDAFAAGYLSGRLDGLPAADRLARAVTTGAFAVAARGDWEGAPRRADLALVAAPDGTTLR